MVRRTVRMAAGAVLVLGGLVGCGASEGDGGEDPKAGSTAAAGTSAGASPAASQGVSAAGAAKPAGSLGAAGSACPLPVSFDLAADWKPKAVTSQDDEQFAALFKQGGTTLQCEIDAKPAGNIGFLRVWTADLPAIDARAVLEAFVAGEKTTGTPTYTPVRAGALPAVEAAYETRSPDERKQEHAFAVVTPGGKAVVVQLGGLDTQEHDAMLPVYRLVQQSLKPQS
ncbi:lipoprotein [Streptomyces virginiae]|uniref:lipoprotein n=1 Tax=Streptomyces virginiae TaxID=1961 RepID=UPI0035DE9006